MLVLLADSNLKRAAAVARELHTRAAATITASTYDELMERLVAGIRPSALFVGGMVSPVCGSDVLGDLERLGVCLPTVAIVASEDSLLAVILRRGGIDTSVDGSVAKVIALRLIVTARGSARRRRQQIALIDSGGPPRGSWSNLAVGERELER